MGTASAVVVAAGNSRRMGGNVDKTLLPLGAHPVLAHALLAFERCPAVDEVVLVVRADRVAASAALAREAGCAKVRRVVAGGATRLASVRAGVAACDPAAEVIAVHDGARPCVTPDLIARCVASAREFGSGVAAAKVTDTVKAVAEDGVTVARTVDRTPLWTAQTPQAFRAPILRDALARAADGDPAVTDEAAAVEQAGGAVRLVPSTRPNPKVTFPDDLALAERLLALRD